MGEYAKESTVQFENPSNSLPGAHPTELLGRGSSAIVEGTRKDTGSYKLHEMHIEGLQENYAVEQGRAVEADGRAGSSAGAAAGQLGGKIEENKRYKSPTGCPSIKDSDGELLNKKDWKSSGGTETAKPLQEDPDDLKKGGESSVDHLRKLPNNRAEETQEEQNVPARKREVPEEQNVPARKGEVPEAQSVPLKKNYMPSEKVPEQKN